MWCVVVLAFKRFGKMWQDVSKEVKDTYIKKAKLLKAQYQVNLAAYEAKKKGVLY